jgi:hypothetical protein
MMTVEFITALFYEVDEQMHAIPKHPEAGFDHGTGHLASMSPQKNQRINDGKG